MQVILPYLKQKLDHWFEEARHSYNIGQQPKVGIQSRMVKLSLYNS